MKIVRKGGATSNILQIFIADSSSTTGGGLTGLTNASSGLTGYFHRDVDTTATSISIITMTVGTFTSGGFKEIDATNMPGWYQFCPPDTAFASGAKSTALHLKGVTNMAPLPIEVDLWAVDPQVATNMGITALPTTAVTTNASLITSGTGTDQLGVASGRVDAGKILGTAISTPATAGILDVNVKNMNNIAATSITTVSANQGTTQPINFTGTGASALAKSDMVDIAGAAVSTSTAQLGVNVVNWSGTAATSTVPPDAIFIRSGTAQAGGASSITLDAGASATNNLYQNEVIFIRSGTGAGQSNIIASYVGGTKVATVSNAWATNPDNTSVFSIIAAGPVIASVSGTVTANVTQWNGTNVATPATAGIPEVNVKNINNVSAASVTTINANQGTTQPLNFTGTGVSALVKSDMVDIAGAAVSTSTAQIGVNAVNIGGTAQTGRDIGASVLISSGTGTGQLDVTSGVIKANLAQILGTALTETAGQLAAGFKQFFNIASPTSTMNLITGVTTVITTTTATNLTNAPTAGDFTSTMKTSLNAATPASVTGSVGSVTGNVGGNVTGSVGSVVAGVTVTTNNDKTGYALTSAEHTAIGADVLDVSAAAHNTAGTIGAKINSAASAGDPWATALPGSYTSGQAGNIVGNNLNATISSRLAAASYTAPDNTSIAAIKAKTDNLPASPAATGDAMTLTSGERTTLAGVVGSTPQTESYPTVGGQISLAQSAYVNVQNTLQSSIAGTTKTIKKRDQSTAAKTGTLDSATTPTSITEAT